MINGVLDCIWKVSIDNVELFELKVGIVTNHYLPTIAYLVYNCSNTLFGRL